MKKFWIKLSRYWKGVSGQKWLSTDPVAGYIPNGNTSLGVTTDNYTAFFIET